MPCRDWKRTTAERVHASTLPSARPALQCSALRRRWAFTTQASAASAGAPGRYTSAHAVRRGTSRARKRRGMGNSLGAPGLLR